MNILSWCIKQCLNSISLSVKLSQSEVACTPHFLRMCAFSLVIGRVKIYMYVLYPRRYVDT